jgi:hypothetical protein
MVRVVVYGVLGFFVGLIFGFACYLITGAIAGAAIGSLLGVSGATYVTWKGTLDGPLFTQQDVDMIMSRESNRLLPWQLLPRSTKDCFLTAIRSALERLS